MTPSGKANFLFMRGVFMEPLRDLPLGFGMALFENERAAQNFEAMDHSTQQTVLQEARAVRSKNDMRALVHRIGGEADG